MRNGVHHLYLSSIFRNRVKNQEINFVAFSGSLSVNPTRDFDKADYDYALNNYNKMLEAIAEADIKVNNYLEKNEVSEYNYKG